MLVDDIELAAGAPPYAAPRAGAPAPTEAVAAASRASASSRAVAKRALTSRAKARVNQASSAGERTCPRTLGRGKVPA